MISLLIKTTRPPLFIGMDLLDKGFESAFWLKWQFEALHTQLKPSVW